MNENTWNTSETYKKIRSLPGLKLIFCHFTDREKRFIYWIELLVQVNLH